MLKLSEAAAAVHGVLHGPDTAFEGVGSDSRRINPGDLFVALCGERFDGHAFLSEVAAQGAVGALVSQDMAPAENFALIRVEDTRRALGELAADWRSRLGIPLVAITGSNGKTTVKEMLATIATAASDAGSVLATQGNLNNDIGMPLTLLGLREHHRYAIIEMGMNHAGELDGLTRIARPDVALVNNAGAAHLAGLGSIEAVAHAKGEIFAGLSANGCAIINLDDPHAGLWRELARDHRQITFALDHPAEVTGRCLLSGRNSEIDITTPQGHLRVVLRVPGIHNVRNALAATAAALALDIGLDAIRAGLEVFSGVKGRLQHKAGLHGAQLIDDTYNANPASVKAAIEVLAAATGQRLLVLGDMGELGAGAEALHADIGHAARAAGIDALLGLGEQSRSAVEAFGDGARHFESIEQLLAEVENRLDPHVTVLVKGSRFMQMERVVKSFEAGADARRED